MNLNNLNKISKFVKVPMTRVMAQAWTLSAYCRHTGKGRGLLRGAPEGLK